jgi:hypothetical protein
MMTVGCMCEVSSLSSICWRVCSGVEGSSWIVGFICRVRPAMPLYIKFALCCSVALWNTNIGTWLSGG